MRRGYRARCAGPSPARSCWASTGISPSASSPEIVRAARGGKRRDQVTLATILEVKEKLSGERHEFASDLLALGEDEAVSLYTLPRDGQLGGVALAAGTRCLGHFWATRPYNVYHAVDANGRAIVYYINLSDRTVI